MNQNTQLKIEYFGLCNYLNKSNQEVNQKTEILFYIKTEKSSSNLYATTNKNYNLKLIYQRNNKKWVPCGHSHFTNLEENLSKWAQQNNFEKFNSSDLTKLIKSLIFHDFEEH